MWKRVIIEIPLEASTFHLDRFSHSLAEFKGDLYVYGGATWNKLAGLIMPHDIVALNLKTNIPRRIDVKGTI